MATINKGVLDELAGLVPPALIDAVDDGLRWFLRLDDS